MRQASTILACILCIGVAVSVQAQETDPSSRLPVSLSLQPGELKTLAVQELTRVAVGNPDVLDVTVVSPRELLIHAKGHGSTSLILWDGAGQHVTDVIVRSRAIDDASQQVTQLLTDLGFATVQLKREQDRLFLIGEVSDQHQLDRLEQMLSAFSGVTNLVSVTPPPPAPPVEAAPLVKLAVQLVELNRSEVEKLGVKWSESVQATEAAIDTATSASEIFRFGTALTRGSITATLNALVKKNKGRILSEPTLVTSSGKEASSFIGVDVPILTATSFSTTTAASSASVEFRKTGVLLRMTPTVDPNDPERNITIVMEAEVSSIDETSALKVPVGTTTASVPGFKVTKATTEVTTVSGQSVVIAGLLSVEDTEEVSQVPAFGGIPIFGRLFRSPEIENTQREIVIVVTPEALIEGVPNVKRSKALEQALATADVTALLFDQPTLRYAMQVQQQIVRVLSSPTDGTSGQVTLRLHVQRDGRLREATVWKSSGVERLDQEALRAAQQQAPYSPFLPGIPQHELMLDVPIIFNR